MECIVHGCTRKFLAKGFCRMHYGRWKLHGDPGGVDPLRQKNRTCSVPGCGKKHQAHGLCPMHRVRKMKTGDVGPAERRIAGQGQGCIVPAGYRVLSGRKHPNAAFKPATNSFQIAEHRLVMAQTLGRPLRKGESVHHRNGVRHDNRPENLELWTTSQPSGQRVADRIDDALRLLRDYADQPQLWPEDAHDLLAILQPQLSLFD